MEDDFLSKYAKTGQIGDITEVIRIVEGTTKGANSYDFRIEIKLHHESGLHTASFYRLEYLVMENDHDVNPSVWVIDSYRSHITPNEDAENTLRLALSEVQGN